MAEVRPFSLQGKRVVVTRAAQQSSVLLQQLSERGAIPILIPLISFAPPDDCAPMDASLKQLEDFDWIIFTSANAVQAVVARCMILGRKLNPGGHIPRIAAVGPATAEAARQAGLPTDFVANTHNGVALANELGDTLRERSVFLPRSDRANPDLPEALRRNGARVTEVIAYRTLPANNPDQEQIKRIVGGEADAILFFSPSAVQNLAELVGGERLRTLGTKPVCVAVGPVTQRALREAGVQSILIAADATTSAVIETLEEHFTGKEKKSHAGVERG